MVRRICFHCGTLPCDWPDNGFQISEEMYCCRGCAEKTGCTCGQEEESGAEF